MKSNEYEVLLERHPSNPILTATDWPYPVHTVFNPGATLLKDGTTLLLCRVEDRRGISHLCAARSQNGINGWVVDSKPTFAPDPMNYPEELWGVEDPRITYMEELDEYLITYTAFGKAGPGVAIASTSDFKRFERFGLVMHANDKDAALFPHRFNGEFALIHRPSTDMGSHMWLSFSPDLRNWGGHMLFLPARRGAWWDANKIGLSPPPIETDRGWLVMYHGVRQHAAGSVYRLGLALFDKDNPETCLTRGQSWMFGPEAPYEISGDVGYAVFPCGYTIGGDGDTLRLYYGAADSSICVATGSIKKMLKWLDRNGSEFTGVAGQAAERIELSSPL
ncbi:MAG: glycosidase [Fimbriimonas ginsengisoli]|uniref:Glycosidase n=1 Tax=Fimbriimonas ginsengisoli TaxID=1005039 RepID=A0A931PVA1_FIMGI|nr:glycosidase [Fimbriimonas ginsengisoli]